jgi:hypothetical protein
MDVLKAAEILIEKIRKDYQDDVAVVVIMGSYIYDALHSRSDLDMYYVPKTERGRNLARVFIIDGIGFDIWPISWERLERIAGHEEKITSIVTEGRVLYHGSEEDLERFNQLRAKGLDVSDRNKFMDKAQKQVDQAYKAYFRLLRAEQLPDARMQAMGIIFPLTYAIALLNGTTVKRGRGKLKQEIMDMPLVPPDFPELYDTVFSSMDMDEMRNAYGQLIHETQELVRKEQDRLRPAASFTENLDGFYEELINFYNKIYHACEIGDTCTALFAATEIMYEIEDAFTGTGVSPGLLPDIVGAFDPQDIGHFLDVVKAHQEAFVALLQEKGVTLRVLQDFSELEALMASL